MKKVLILFGKSKWEKSKPFINAEYQYSYEHFYTLCKENGIQMYRASYQWYDKENHIFKHAWKYEGTEGNWTKVESITPDLIYDKTKADIGTYREKLVINEHYPFINDLNFTRVIDDKFITSLIFSEWSKKNWFVKSEAELNTVLPELKTEKIVVKPVSESGGNGVCIVNKSEIGSLDFSNEKIVQEFIDSSNGIPGLSDSTHDLRLVFVGKKLIYAYIREPKDGCFLANLAQGGTLTIVPIENLPKSLDPVLRHVHAILDSFTDRIFAVDFMFDENSRPWIVEFNSMPGLYFTEKEKPYMMEMYQELLGVFKRQLALVGK
ncbi:MAG: ATP-grasp domain-containing protein [Candidatus Moraniibacteriota bacterium]